MHLGRLAVVLEACERGRVGGIRGEVNQSRGSEEVAVAICLESSAPPPCPKPPCPKP